MKKIIALLLVLVMVFSMAACNKNADKPGGNEGNGGVDNGNEDPGKKPISTGNEREGDLTNIIPKETLDLVVYTQLANYSGEQVGWFADVLLEKFNVRFTIINDSPGTFTTRMANGDLGDIVVFGNDGNEYQQAISAGLLFDWEEDDLLAEFGPYINANMKVALEKNRLISNDPKYGNKIYGFGHNVASTANDVESYIYHPDIRWDLYKELGYPEVNTLEDYIPLLEKMAEICPTSDSGSKTFGVSVFPDWDGNMVMYVKSTSALYGYEEFALGLYDVNTQTFQGCLEPGGMYIRAIKFYNTLFQKGLFDPDSMTQTSADLSEKYADGRGFFSLFTFTGTGSYNTPTHTDAGKGMYALPPKDGKVLVSGLNVNGGNRVYTIGSRTPYPELCMAIINWLCTPEGKMISMYGPKGLTWDYDENKYPYFTELGRAAQKDGNTIIPPSNSAWKDGVNAINNPTWASDASNPDAAPGIRYNKTSWPSEQDQEQPDIFKDWQNFTGYKTEDEFLIGEGYMSIALGTTYSESPKSPELEIIWNQVTTVVVDGTWKAIYAASDAECDQIIADMVKQANDYGYKECNDYGLSEAVRRKAAEDFALGK